MDDGVTNCLLCGKRVFGSASCGECMEACMRRDGHVLVKVKIIDNNFDLMRCVRCGVEDISQCKDARKWDG